MVVEFNKLPKKAYRNKNAINGILQNAEDKIYCIVQIDYKTGLIRFQSLLSDRVFIHLWTTKMTLMVEDKSTKRKMTFYNLSTKEINKKFNKNQDRK